ncbi:regulator of telomere elongation helicase 1-like [Xenia sp. Carnegie-2017]|uniref:regulator of telomere elongation helicase 1-like n=1 Tax=Xenia sp. Carnegie-2017 TaxID=2897299 RepID=UPI001F037F61|nr:regulator of telomere elongation helicase 1-like [Xenia sp. Carnegie-2017]
MSVINIRGVEITFPFKPYDCQIKYMEKVIQCLEEGKNGILESPTGTGKTLCLLCATLAWRDTYKAHLQLNTKVQQKKANGRFYENLKENLGQAAIGWSDDDDGNPDYEVPKIIYTSRTHSQLTQAVKELKNTIYKPKVCVLGSREQLCIHPQVVQQETHSAKMQLCRAKVESKKCHYYNNLEKEESDSKQYLSDILDIEDLVSLGKKQSCCPYYLSRQQKKSADIIFMPYNYLIDSKARNMNGIEISKSIILFDEAHNIEQSCEEAMSFDLTSYDIASCIEDLDRCLDILTQMEEDGTLALVDDVGNSNDVGLDKKEIAFMKGLLLMLEEELSGIISKTAEGITKPGSYMFELLEKVKITRGTQSQVVDQIEKICTFLVANGNNGMKPKQLLLDKFSNALKIIFQGSSPSDSGKSSGHYKVHIQSREILNYRRNQIDVWSTSKTSVKDLVKHELRSMILTSGTLTPLKSFKAELQIPKMVVKTEQRKPIFVEPQNKCWTMDGFYEKVKSTEFKGAMFLAVCRGKVSEGVNFSDINGRAVVITGLPYPPAYDARVKLKQQFLDEVKNKKSFVGLTGRQWYQQQASRAVNQAVGRVLRHKEDFGAIIFCDERFAFPMHTAELPKWMKPYIRGFENFGSILKELLAFFRRAVELCDESSMKVKKQTNDVTVNDVETLSHVNPASLQKKYRPVVVSHHSAGVLPRNIPPARFHKNRAKIHLDELPETPVKIQYEITSSNDGKENTSKKTTSNTSEMSNGFFDSLQKYEAKKATVAVRKTLPSSSNVELYASSSDVKKPTVMKKKLKS